MIPLTFGQVEKWTGGESLRCPLDQEVTKLAIDSRESGPGVLFCALPGTRTDGHAFVEEVWRRGGVALVRKDFPNRTGPQIRVDSPLDAMGRLLRRYIDKHGIAVVGVTGSVGKTSVKELSAAVLRQRYVTTSSLGNYNTAIGLPLSFFAGSRDTTHFVAEMGMSAPGEIRQLTEIAPPDVAVISTIGSSHMEKLGSMEAIQRAKDEILQGLKPNGLAVLNRDNHWVRELGERTSRRVVWFGAQTGVDARVESAMVTATHTVMELVIHGRAVKVRLPWLGAHQSRNVAAALLVGQELGVSLDEAVAGMETIDAARSRIHLETVGAISLMTDLYNASPLSAMAALDVLHSRSGRRVAVIGDMLELGDAEIAGHRQVGEYMHGRADLLLAVGPRAHHTYEAAQQAGVAADWVRTREDAFLWLAEHLCRGDVVLLKASRAMQFEWLAERLRDWGPNQ